MEVLVIARGVPSEEFPQNGIFEFDHATALQNEGVNVVYLAIDIRSFRRRRQWGLVRDEGKSTESLLVYSYNIPLGPLPLSIRVRIERIAIKYAFQKLYRKKESRPNIIHCHFGLNGYAARELKNKGTPFVITEHFSGMNQPHVKRDVLRYSRQGYQIADCVIAVSKTLKRNIYLNTGVHSVVINNIVDCSIFERNVKRPHEEFCFVTTSNLTEIKQIPFLIQEFIFFHREYPQTRLVIIGGGELEFQLKDMVEKSGAYDYINFLGKKNRTEIAEIYEECDCFVMVSRSETFGVAFVEAIAAGLPVIGTDCGGPSEFINDGNGILIPVNDSLALRKAMLFMYRHANEYDVDKMRKFVIDKYSPGVVGKRIMKLYRDLLEKEYK